MYKVKEFARLVGVSVRMLHHYDTIGLLLPETTTSKGYRLYGNKSFKRVQEILFFKELDFSLKDIKALLDRDDVHTKEILTMQKELLSLKRQRLTRLESYLDRLLDDQTIDLSQAIKIAFDEQRLKDTKMRYTQEAKERWGETPAYKESQKRYASYSKEQLKSIQEEQGKLYSRLALLLDLDISDAKVQANVKEAQEFITRYWYECTNEIFASLGEMYIADERFTQSIDTVAGKEGTAAFLSKAIAYYCNPT